MEEKTTTMSKTMQNKPVSDAADEKAISPSTTKIPAKLEGETELSEYETIRAKNIERNNAKLLNLGLISKAEQEYSDAVAWKRQPPALAKKLTGENSSDDEYNDDDDDSDSASGRNTGKKRKKRSTKQDRREQPERKSLRVQGLQPDGNVAVVTPRKSRESIEEERKLRREECREARQRAALQYAHLGTAKAAKENPTATYEHCLMRVRTMTDPKLETRIRVIERAAGKHCVVKMAIFASCLKDENKHKLAELANEALERLKGQMPPPDV